MFISQSDLLLLLEHYKYILIFPIIILEGPIITVICGFLVYLGQLNGPATYIMLVTGDLIGDILHWALGRYFKNRPWFRRVASIFGYDDEKEKRLEAHFKNHPGKTVLIAKVSHGIGGFIQTVAGIAKIDFWKFTIFSFIGTVPKALALFLLGYYLGSSYLKIDSYLDYIAYFVISIVILVSIYLLLKKYVKRKLIIE